MLAILPDSVKTDPMKADSNNHKTICPLEKKKKKLLKGSPYCKSRYEFSLYTLFRTKGEGK